MNYHHIFHAGNFADVLKHLVLVALFTSLAKKDSPILYLDTHAGIGCYDLTTPAAQKTSEFTNGIAKIYQRVNCSATLQHYQALVRKYNQTGLTCYPGSPALIHSLLRKQDRMLLVELHREDAQVLARFFSDRRVMVHNSDGYQSIKAFLPPKQGRALILLDPAYEDPKELASVTKVLQEASKQCPRGTYLVWLPLKTKVTTFYNTLTQLPFGNILLAELVLQPINQEQRLSGCGIVVINAPWQFEVQLKALLSELYAILASKNGYQLVRWLIKPK